MSTELSTVSGFWKGHLRVSENARVPDEKDVQIYEAKTAGMTTKECSEYFDVSESKVRGAVKVVENFYASKVSVDVSQLKLKQHMMLDALIESALKEYQKSGGEVKTVKRKKVKTEEGEFVVEEVETVRELCRDPKYLNFVKEALKDQRAIWPGANAPAASALTDSTGTGNARIDVAHLVSCMTPEQQQIIDVLAETALESGELD